MYSIHAPGLPALVLPAFAIGGYHGVVVFLILSLRPRLRAGLVAGVADDRQRERGMVRLGGRHAVARRFSSRATRSFPTRPGAVDRADGLLGAAARGLGDASSGTRELRSAGRSWVPWLLHGAALALLPWLHTRFAVLAATLGGLILVRLARAPNPFAKASAFLALPAVGALAWLFFFLVVYGTPDPIGALWRRRRQNSLAFLPNGLGGLLFDQGFGLLATAPVLAVAFVGFTRTRRLALEWLVVADSVPAGGRHVSRCGGPDRADRRVSWCRCCCRWRFRRRARWAARDSRAAPGRS